MATPLDLGLLQNVQLIFPFLLVLVFVFAVLTRVPSFKERMGLAALIAFILAVMVLFSRVAVKTINMMAPWFVLLFVFAILGLVAYQTFGVKEETILGVLTGKEYGSDFGHIVLALILIIGLGSLFTVLAEEKGGVPGPGLSDKEGSIVSAADQTGTATQKSSFWTTIFHPKVLGMVLILLIAMFAIQKLSKRD